MKNIIIIDETNRVFDFSQSYYSQSGNDEIYQVNVPDENGIRRVCMFSSETHEYVPSPDPPCDVYSYHLDKKKWFEIISCAGREEEITPSMQKAIEAGVVCKIDIITAIARILFGKTECQEDHLVAAEMTMKADSKVWNEYQEACKE